MYCIFMEKNDYSFDEDFLLQYLKIDTFYTI